MSTPRVDEVTVQAGASWRRSYPVFDSTGNGPVLDLADWTVRADVRPARSPTGPILHSWSTEPGAGRIEVHRREALNAAGLPVETDHFRFVLTPDESAGFTWPFGIALVELENTAGDVETPVELRITVRSETTIPLPPTIDNATNA